MSSRDQYAYLGMYDFPALHPAQDAWWFGLAKHFAGAGISNIPDALNRSVADPHDIWESPDLFLAQTCGYPLTHRLAGKVRLIGTPCYDVPACDGALYRSLFIVRSEQKPENLASALPARIAVNGLASYSGWWAFSRAVEALGLKGEPFTETVISGGHAKSIDLVREGRADIAAIDCVTHALIEDVEPERLTGLTVLEQSAPAPGLPYITRGDRDETDIRRMVRAIENAMEDPDLADARKALRLAGFCHVPLQEYEEIMI
ncbi:MAG: PhnD/SsuA/transferrin family substrate-binding protein [Rhodospirillaceae bacterium]|nr:PhnD/SsuA/transferrin family substrate-binding protein [Rhodospirillaceae bacterium]